jgi:FkbM family methyltransferase
MRSGAARRKAERTISPLGAREAAFLLAERSTDRHAPAVHHEPTVLHRIRKLGHRIGVDVRRWPTPRDPATAHVDLLRSAGIDLVLDVGAAGGGYGSMLRDRGHPGRIVSCEPLPESFHRLKGASESDPLWEVRRTAVGAQTGVAQLQVAGNADSSSLLPMLDRHTDAAPHTATVGSIEVEVTTVDELLDDVAQAGDRVLLKLDVQGAESDVLDGTPLDRITAIHLEHSLVELYDGSVTFDDLHARLRGAGFELVDVSPGFRDPRSSRLLQFDATYLRAEASG